MYEGKASQRAPRFLSGAACLTYTRIGGHQSAGGHVTPHRGSRAGTPCRLRRTHAQLRRHTPSHAAAETGALSGGQRPLAVGAKTLETN